jgi:aquaporin Z
MPQAVCAVTLSESLNRSKCEAISMSAHTTTEEVIDALRQAGGAPARGAVATRKYAVELIGTFFLVFTVGASTFSGSQFAPLAIGAALMAMIYADAHLSGGHYNPAVTPAALVRGRIGLGDAAGYWIAQLTAGLVAALLIRWVGDSAQVKTLMLSGHALSAAFVVELLFTFALAYVVLNVATSKSHPDNSFYGLAIGFTVVAGAFAVGGISGAAFNPAVTLGAGHHEPIRLAHPLGLPERPTPRRSRCWTHLPSSQPRRQVIRAFESYHFRNNTIATTPQLGETAGPPCGDRHD